MRFLDSIKPSLYKFITPPARRAWRSYKFAAFCFFGCQKLDYRSWVIPLYILLSEPCHHGFLNSNSSNLCHQNTQIKMYTITSKPQEVSTCEDSYPKCFITTSFDKFHCEQAINRSEILRACFRHFPLCLHFNFYTLIKLMSLCAYVLRKYLNKIHFLTCKKSTVREQKIYAKNTTRNVSKRHILTDTIKK